MRDKGLGIAITFAFIGFVLMYALTDGFAASTSTQEMVASSDVTVRATAPGVTDDISANFLRGFIWIDTVGAKVYIAEDTTAGAAVWTDITAGGSTFKGFTLESPADVDNILLWKAPYALTITDIFCLVDPADTGETVVIDIQERDGSGDTPATVDATITCSNTGAEDDGALSNGPIDSGDWISIDIGTVTGTVTQLSVTLHFTVDGV